MKKLSEFLTEGEMTLEEDASNLTQKIAKVCHEVNRAYCAVLGDKSQPTWETAPDWQKESAISGVEAHLKNPNMSGEDAHNVWVADKVQAGWKHGPVKDAEKKEHPSLVPYNQLPASERAKDILFSEIVKQLKTF